MTLKIHKDFFRYIEWRDGSISANWWSRFSFYIITIYDLSERGLNVFDYQSMGQNKIEEALKVFKLNTELYPDAYNTFDSYGECLLEIAQRNNLQLVLETNNE